ncbi:C40 family peptidase [Pendulispora rubella]|uniref:C40 family peptidase n=1 Tax=Pendulispora rubella TaxID=2741070 RepID=A0ABZ2L306_9BACT
MNECISSYASRSLKTALALLVTVVSGCAASPEDSPTADPIHANLEQTESEVATDDTEASASDVEVESDESSAMAEDSSDIETQSEENLAATQEEASDIEAQADDGSVDALAVTPASAIARGKKWLHAYHGGPVPYSQGSYFEGWRQDCSGYVSMAWNVRDRKNRRVNHNTDSMLNGGYGTPGKIVHPIRWQNLRKGDVIGFLGTGSLGDAGHVMIFEKWANKKHTAYWVYEQAGGGGTKHRTHPKSYGGSHYKPYRYDKITCRPNGATTGGGDECCSGRAHYSGSSLVCY